MMNLKNEIIENCGSCNGTGFHKGKKCDCIVKFRAYLWMLDNGFIRRTLDIVSDNFYNFPDLESGYEAVEYYFGNFQDVCDKGLSLYLFSKERGWGKTTFAHYIVYEMAKFFLETENYARDRSFGFEHVEDMLKRYRTGDDLEIWRSTVYVLDDVGNEDKSSNWKKEVVLSGLQRVMHHRRDHRLPTIITSNYCPSDLSAIYDGVLDSLLEINPGGQIGGSLIRQVEVGGGEDFRTMDEFNQWPSDVK